MNRARRRSFSQDRGRVVHAQCLEQRSVEPLQTGGHAQERQHGVGLPTEDLLCDVGKQRSLRSSQPLDDCRPTGIGSLQQGLGGEAHGRRPAARHGLEARGKQARLVAQMRQQRRRFVLGEGQPIRCQFDDLALAAQALGPERDRPPADEHEVERRWGATQEALDEPDRLDGADDLLEVVEDEDAVAVEALGEELAHQVGDGLSPCRIILVT